MANLKKKSCFYKMEISDSVEEKIRYMQQKYPSTEWSGVLFCQHKGSFENNDLIIICKDIYPMDLGSAVFTQFKYNTDVINYMVENDLIDCDMQLVHSHHNMTTSPSGTDTNTLLTEGQDTNNFVSLIVNNAGTYWAAVTRKVQMTIPNVKVEYSFFDEGMKETSVNYTTAIDIEYYPLQISKNQITIDPTDDKFRAIDKRFEEIVASKPKIITPTQGTLPFWGEHSWGHYDDDYFSTKRTQYPQFESPKQTFNKVQQPAVHKEANDEVEYILPIEVLEEICCILLTCDLFYAIKHRSINLQVVYDTHKAYMEKYFDNVDFDFWTDNIIEYILMVYSEYIDYRMDNTEEDEELRQSLMEKAEMLSQDYLIARIVEQLESLTNKNKYIDAYIKALRIREV